MTTISYGLHSYRPYRWRDNMFKTQVEPPAAGEWFHCKVLNIPMVYKSADHGKLYLVGWWLYCSKFLGNGWLVLKVKWKWIVLALHHTFKIWLSISCPVRQSPVFFLVRLPVWRPVSRQRLSKWRSKCSDKNFDFITEILFRFLGFRDFKVPIVIKKTRLKYYFFGMKCPVV